jgi:hypothetical protein
MRNIFEINNQIFQTFYFRNIDTVNVSEKYLDKNNLLDYHAILTKKKLYKYNDRISDVEQLIRIFNQIEKKTGIPYYTMKSFLNYPFIDDDIDFIITEDGYKIYVKELKKRGFTQRSDLADIGVVAHVHSEVSWNGIIVCDKDDVFIYAEWREIGDELFRVPSVTDELLIAIGHFLFENYYFKIGEFIYNKKLLNSEIDYGRIEKTATKYGYRKGVTLFFEYLKGISDIYQLDLKIPKKYVLQIPYIKKENFFPYYIPYQKLFPVYYENFSLGVKKFQIVNLFRKLFTYTLVGYLWKYLLQLKRQKKFLSYFPD